MRPEAGAGAGGEAGHLPDRRDVLAGEPSAEHIDRLDGAPVDGGDVAEVRGVGPVVGEDAGDRLVDFREPDRAGLEDFLDGEVEPAVAGEQRPDPQAPVVLFVADIAHEDSGRSVIPGRRSTRELDTGLVTCQVLAPLPEPDLAPAVRRSDELSSRTSSQSHHASCRSRAARGGESEEWRHA